MVNPHPIRFLGLSIGLAPYLGGGALPKTGMIHSIFRPSDDGTIFPYLVPSNIFAYISLDQMSELYN